jgi:hypothetical protein
MVFQLQNDVLISGPYEKSLSWCLIKGIHNPAPFPGLTVNRKRALHEKSPSVITGFFSI